MMIVDVHLFQDLGAMTLWIDARPTLILQQTVPGYIRLRGTVCLGQLGEDLPLSNANILFATLDLWKACCWSERQRRFAYCLYDVPEACLPLFEVRNPSAAVPATARRPTRWLRGRFENIDCGTKSLTNNQPAGRGAWARITGQDLQAVPLGARRNIGQNHWE